MNENDKNKFLLKIFKGNLNIIKTFYNCCSAINATNIIPNDVSIFPRYTTILSIV